MGKIKQDLRKLFCDELYQQNQETALKRNRAVLRAVLAASIACLLLLLSASLLLPAYSHARGIYAGMLSLYVVMQGLSLLLKDCSLRMLIYGLHFCFIAFCTYTSAVLWPDDVCVMILSELFIFPILFLDKGWHITSMTVLSAAVYLVVIRFYKIPACFYDETINVICFTLLGSIVGIFTRRSQIQNLDSVETLRISQEHYQLALKHTGGVICEYDVAQECINMTPDVAASFGVPQKMCDIPNAPVRDGKISADSRDAYMGFYAAIKQGCETGSAVFEGKTARGWRWQEARFSTIFSSDGKPVSAVISFVDITEQRAREALQREQAEKDGMTGVYNRSTTETKVNEKLSKEPLRPCAFVIADIDDLKQINDTLGHPRGDEAIQALASALRGQAGQVGVVGRVGGDEFVILLEGEEAVRTLDRTLTALLERIAAVVIGTEDGRRLSISMGAVLGTPRRRSFDELYRRADQALYMAKQRGKGQYALYREPTL